MLLRGIQLRILRRNLHVDLDPPQYMFNPQAVRDADGVANSRLLMANRNTVDADCLQQLSAMVINSGIGARDGAGESVMVCNCVDVGCFIVDNGSKMSS